MPELTGFLVDSTIGCLPPVVQVYVVGGAVRDQLLGQEASDKDWVVVGADAHEMELAGFTPVGSDFPVFLHPKTKQEYALARTERKSGRGYKGFTFYASKEVTLEQDLQRRDFTINAMAMTQAGDLIDPYGGQADLNIKVFRHVSPAFSEDPLRVLRLARFLARFTDFNVAQETKDLCQHLVDSGEMKYLVPERVFTELDRAMGEKSPGRAWAFLAELGVWGDLSAHAPQAWRQLDSEMLGFLNSSMPKEAKWQWWLAMAGFKSSILPLCQELKVPNELRDGALVWAALVDFVERQRAGSANESEWLDLLSQVDLYRKPERLDQILKAFRLLCTEGPVMVVLQKLLGQVLSGQFKTDQKDYLDSHPEHPPVQAVADFRLLWLKKALS